jgi:hypothetical protein
MISEANYITAHFIDNERKNIEVLLKSDDGVSAYTHILEYDSEHPDCKELLEVCNLDQLHENTWEKKKEETKLFEDSLVRVAEKTGLIKKILKISQKAEAETFFGALFDFLLTDKKEHIDRLFNFKLHLFEQDVIKKSKDEEAKSNIRKAKTPLGAFKEFIKIWEESN